MGVISRILSWIFLPLFMPIYALAIGLYLEAYQYSLVQRNSLFVIRDDYKTLLLYMFTALSAVFPILSIGFFRINGTITSLMMDKRSERILPALFVNGSAITLYFLLQKLDPHSYLPYSIYALVSGSFITVFIATIVTFWWKISLHAAGMGILTGFVLCYFGQMDFYPFWILPAVFIVSGLVLSARMYLKCHSILEITAGYLLGILATAICMYLSGH